MGSIEVERSPDGRTATVTLARTEQRNALSIPMLRDLTGALGDLAVQPGLRAVILAGGGPDFCAGADVAELSRIVADPGEAAIEFDRPFREALSAVADLPVPVVARVQGRALGGGCQLILACDLAVAEEDARLGIPAARLGIVIPYDSVERLVLAVGPRRAREMLYTGRVVAGTEAAAWGLVTAAAPAGRLDPAVDQVVGAIVDAAPLSVRASKRAVAAMLERLTQARPGESSATADFEMMAAQALASRDLAEGIAAFRERRAPEFRGE